ncbi:MAG: Gfo/Idh/MocA family protein [Nitrospiraceae bacterium]
MRKLRVGVIGVGHLGQHHARLYASLPGSMLAGVMDIKPDRARLIGERHGVPVYPDPEALLKQVDAVSVAVPTSAHHAVVKTCLDAGVHVLVEKPIAVTTAEAQELVGLARKRGRVLQVGHVERFNPVVRAVRPSIGKPGFIECHRLSPFGERGTDVDVVLDLMIHDLDMVLSFGPGPVEEVRAAGVPVLSSTIDIANARIAFGSGCVANLTASRVSMTRQRRLRLFQQDAYVSVDYHTRQGVICRRMVRPGEPPKIEVEQVQGGDEEPLKLQLAAFLHSVAAGTPPAVSGEDGAAALTLAHQVLDAIGTFVRRHTESGGQR